MNKLNVTVNKDGKCLCEFINLTYDSPENSFDNTVRTILSKIATDVIDNDAQCVEYLIDNCSQEEVLLMATNFIKDEFKKVVKKSNKRAKKSKSPISALISMMEDMKQMSQFLERHKMEFCAESKEDLITKMTTEFAEKGITIDSESLDKCTTEAEFLTELNRQIGSRGFVIGGHRFGSNVSMASSSDSSGSGSSSSGSSSSSSESGSSSSGSSEQSGSDSKSQNKKSASASK